MKIILGQIYNLYACTTLLTMRKEFTQRNILGKQAPVPLYENIFKKVFNQSFYGVIANLQAQKADSNNFEYLTYLKSHPIEVTDNNRAKLKNTTFFVNELNKIKVR